MESAHTLSLKKTASYRVLAFTIDILLLALFFGPILGILTAVIVRHLVESAVYWVHEHIWFLIPYGRENGHHTDSHKRTLTKTITYRVLTILNDTLILSFWLTTELAFGAAVAIALTNSLVYYLHERWWVRHLKKSKLSSNTQPKNSA